MKNQISPLLIQTMADSVNSKRLAVESHEGDPLDQRNLIRSLRIDLISVFEGRIHSPAPKESEELLHMMEHGDPNAIGVMERLARVINHFERLPPEEFHWNSYSSIKPSIEESVIYFFSETGASYGRYYGEGVFCGHRGTLGLGEVTDWITAPDFDTPQV